ncbi:MAG: class I SAM-dependent DNA methyltransferase [Bosea sp. (in: a-proteobacteria)]
MAVALDIFLKDWRDSAAHERSNFQPFIYELCELIGVDRPDKAGPVDALNGYVFERAVQFRHANGTSSTGFIDLYKRGAFVMEAKQGGHGRTEGDAAQPSLFGGTSGQPFAGIAKTGTAKRGTKAWDDALLRARHQAESYAKALPVDEGWPPFLIVVDVGHVFELYADFSGTGKHYSQFPDTSRFRLGLNDLQRQDVRDMLKTIWTDPQSLDPSRLSARVTRQVADRLAKLSKAYEEDGQDPTTVAQFLMRCLFTMFAEDVNLIPRGSFKELLEARRGDPASFKPMVEDLWRSMDKGGFSVALGKQVKHFNGGLFHDTKALPVDGFKLGLLIDAAQADWKEVEPAIFGTLLERALDPADRSKLGAHYTPRPYVERLVIPTVIEPLRSDWAAVQAAALLENGKGRTAEALQEVQRFHAKLCATTVLDPACGTGNFLYVTLEHMKRIEGEVVDLMRSIGGEEAIKQIIYERSTPSKSAATSSITVDPHQFLGLELNPRAAVITELVLWIGYLQWNVKTHGEAAIGEPVLQDFKNIKQGDAVLAWSGTPQLARDADGKLVTRWDGITMKRHPVTGEDVPDEAARKEVYTYKQPKPAEWPQADFIVGNPPFIGASEIRRELGDGYAEALWEAYPDVPESSDFVMFWWEKAALAARAYDPAKGKGTRRFGFITTNSLRQTFNRRVVQRHLEHPKKGLTLTFAIPDHPWVQESDGAAVRIALTVAELGKRAGRLQRVVKEEDHGQERLGVAVEMESQVGRIAADLRVGADIPSARSLMANDELSCPGMKLHGAGFIVTPGQASDLGLSRVSELDKHIRHYRHGRDLNGRSRGVMVIDLFGLTEAQVRERFPETYQWVLERVKPDRDTNNRDTYRTNWWTFGEPRRDFRPALSGLRRYIATVETSKHRMFQFLDASIVPDNMLIAIASDDAFHLGVLSSRIHVVWALAAGGSLEDRPRYNKTVCFDPFPFPDATPAQQATIRDLAEQLDAHRKRQQAKHPELTLTGIYNVLEKLRAGEALSDTDKATHEAGLVSTLKKLHDDLDRAVADAYGWAVSLSDEDILVKLVALNHEREAEERRGLIRWLRPAYQNPKGTVAATRDQMGMMVEATSITTKPVFPATLPEQVEAIRALLLTLDAPATLETIASAFKSAKRDRVSDVLASLVAMGRAHKLDGETYASETAMMAA